MCIRDSLDWSVEVKRQQALKLRRENSIAEGEFIPREQVKADLTELLLNLKSVIEAGVQKSIHAGPDMSAGTVAALEQTGVALINSLVNWKPAQKTEEDTS